MAEGGIESAMSKTESVPGQRSLHSRHSQVRQGPKAPTDTKAYTTALYTDATYPVVVSKGLTTFLHTRACAFVTYG
ncbi:hypothetical protein DPMN_039705 [Dreissena polymorpha]|uniref:Uncharacterized protein n=1 Tax=Dreissena polymorpha TaxID=45954 RepID=A0A9D4CVR8_DREPO|nr:hypothetical protein DPMN_039705 [Dreissena polymorpha]